MDQDEYFDNVIQHVERNTRPLLDDFPAFISYVYRARDVVVLGGSRCSAPKSICSTPETPRRRNQTPNDEFMNITSDYSFTHT